MDSSERRVPYLGIEWQMDDGAETQAAPVFIVSVRRIMVDSPACKAGVHEGDVIRSVDGISLDADNTLTTIIMARKPGNSVTLELSRANKKVMVKVTLGTRVLPAFKFKPIDHAPLFSESLDTRG